MQRPRAVLRAAVTILAMSGLAACGGGGDATPIADARPSDATPIADVAQTSPGAPALGAPCAKPGDRATADGQPLMCEKSADGKTVAWIPDPYASGGSGSGSSSGSGSGGGASSSPDAGTKKGDWPFVAAAPDCPASLDGLLTASMVDAKDLAAITPLGNVTPPGHTAPIDHQYVIPSRAGKIDLFSPAHAWLAAMSQQNASADGKTFVASGFTFRLVICQGVVLDLAATNVTDLAPAIRAALPADLTTAKSCSTPGHKAGHTAKLEFQCYFSDLGVELAGGERIGTMSSASSPNGGYDMEFETWAANYLVDPPANGINWDWYFDNRYIHAICLYDLFTPALRAGYQAKYGGIDGKTGKFIQRTVDPVCGVTSQDEPGTLSGYWFPAAGGSEAIAGGATAYGENAGISFIRYNVDPSQGQVVVGGGLVPGSAIVPFTLKHSGTIDRDPLEVTPGGTRYCYEARGQIQEMLGGKVIPGDHRFVVQLTDATHVAVDLQAGRCSATVTMGPSPTTYVR